VDVFSELQRQASLIRQLQGALGGKVIAVGASTVTWGGVFTNSGVTTVTHSLGRTPVIVGAWCSDATATEFFFCSAATSTFTTTQFGVRGHARAVPIAQTNTITWIAIG
jgi:hypothetical protein